VSTADRTRAYVIAVTVLRSRLQHLRQARAASADKIYGIVIRQDQRTFECVQCAYAETEVVQL
jgi:hypothetical protein